MIIPPRSTAVSGGTVPTQRDRHLAAIAKHGRIGWQRSPGYNRRSLAETAMYRYKTIIGRRLHARILSNQRTEAKIGCNVLNRMTGLGMPPPGDRYPEYSPIGPSHAVSVTDTVPSITISLVAGTSRSTVSHATTSTGSNALPNASRPIGNMLERGMIPGTGSTHGRRRCG